MRLSYSSGTPDIRKDKVLAFIEKDIFVLNNYETVPFNNKSHAIECLIPYHIFHLTADDIKFKGSDVEIEMKNEVNVMRTKINNMINEHAYDCEGFTPQLLLYHEQRVLNSIAEQGRVSSGLSKKKKQNVDRRFLKVRVPRTEDYHVYGTTRRLRIKIDKKTE